MDVQSQYADLFDKLEERYGLPRGYLNQTAKIESDFNPHSHNELSRADGLFQFIPSTARQYGLRYGRGPGSTGDPIASAEAAARLAADNQERLRGVLKRDPTAGELYIAHQQGGGGASALMANPNAPAGRVVSPKSISQNAGNPRAPASQFVQKWSKQFPTQAAMPFASDDDLISEIGGAGKGRPQAAPATAARGTGPVSDDDLIKELGGPSKGITVEAKPVQTTTIPRKALSGEEVKAKDAAEEEDPTLAESINRHLREHQGSTLKDEAMRVGLGMARGIGNVSDTLLQATNDVGGPGANALARAGIISPQTAQSVGDYLSGTVARAEAAQKEFGTLASKNPFTTEAGVIGGEMAATYPFLRAGGELLPAGPSAALQTLRNTSPTVARLLEGAGIGGTSAALTSSASDQPLGSQVLQSALLGGGIQGALHPIASAIGKYIGNKITNTANMFTEQGPVNTATRILQSENPNAVVDAREIIPGSTPTLAEATGDPHIATIQRNVRDTNSKPFVELEKKNNEARNSFWENKAGTKEDIDTAKSQLDQEAHDALDTIFKPGQKADATPVVAKIDDILAGPSGKRGAVKTVLNDVRKQLVKEPASDKTMGIETFEDDPALLYNSARKHIGDWLDKNADSSAGQQASRELMQVRDTLDKSISKAAPGFDEYLSGYSAAAKPITAMKYLQSLNLTDSSGNMTLSKVDSAIKQIQKGQTAGGVHPANSLDTDHLEALTRLRDDLLRQTKTQSGITKGTSTYQRFATGAKIPNGGLMSKFINPTTLGTGAGYAIGEMLSPGWGSALGMMTGAGAGQTAESVLGRRNALVQTALSHMLTNPEAYSPRAAVGRNNFALQYGLPTMAPGLLQLLSPQSRNKPLDERGR